MSYTKWPFFMVHPLWSEDTISKRYTKRINRKDTVAESIKSF